MDAPGIGGGSPLDRFQQIRDLARKKIEASSPSRGDDNRARLADLLRKKQAELGPGIALDRPRSASRAAEAREPEASSDGAAPAGTGGLSGYGRAGGVERKQGGPVLGRYIDLTA